MSQWIYTPAPPETNDRSAGAFILLGIGAKQLQNCKHFLRFYT